MWLQAACPAQPLIVRLFVLVIVAAATFKLPRREAQQAASQTFSAQQLTITGVFRTLALCSNFQDAEGKKREKAERLRFGRFFYRFPNGESGADVYDRCALLADGSVHE